MFRSVLKLLCLCELRVAKRFLKEVISDFEDITCLEDVVEMDNLLKCDRAWVQRQVYTRGKCLESSLCTVDFVARTIGKEW